MIEVLKEENSVVIKETYIAKNIEYNVGDMLICATENGNTIGQILFSCSKDEIVLKYAEPKEDILLLDGLVRSMLHYASENCIEKAFYAETAPVEQLNKLRFIENVDNKSLKMLGLLGSCENCKNK